MEEKNKVLQVTEKVLNPLPGFLGLFICIVLIVAGGLGLFSAILFPVAVIPAAIVLILGILLLFGLKIVNPNEALVLTLFGKYHGTINKAGFFFVNPFCVAYNPGMERVVSHDATGNVTTKMIGSKKISTKISTLNNGVQKVNDVLGNPIVIGAVVIWKVVNPTSAAFAVENYKEFLSIQCDSTIRNIARLYPYDDMDDSNGIEEKTLRGSSQEIADGMREELQNRVKEAGLEIMEVRITHLSYSEEIAAAMLQRQQAVAVIAARQKIVEGAVSMVEMAINQLGEKEVVCLDDERKAQMVSNLLVVLCGNKEAQPIVNSGTIY
ncbi:MAG: SPFH domain-containing protein [Lachnospiraceae bacterium]|nr:SPFH domain-containing protein [Lachnospiraceae bacterium]